MCAQRGDRSWCYSLEECGSSWAREMVLHHVANVEEGGVRACKVVRGTDGEGCVLDRHLETTERDHFAAIGEVEIIEGCFSEICGGRFMADRGKGSCWEEMSSWGGIGGEGLG